MTDGKKRKPPPSTRRRRRTPTDTPALPDRRTVRDPWRLLGVALIVAAAILAYIPAFSAEFIWDDDLSTYRNPVVPRDDGLKLIWFSTADLDFWPMTKTIFWIEYQLFGRDPTGYHAVNVSLHALAGVLVYLALLRLRIPGAWLAAMVFVVHPVNAASVAWVSELKNLLSMIFLAPTVWAYAAWLDNRRRRWWALAIVLFALALMSKTSVVMIPVFLIAVGWWRRGRLTLRDVLATAPFFAIAAAMSFMTVFVQSRYFDATTEPLDGVYRLAGVGWVVGFYIYKTLLPINLSMIYPHWKDTLQSLGIVSFLPTAAMMAGLIVLCVFRRRWWARTLLLASVYYLAALFPVLGLFKMTYMMCSLVANHFQYVPIIGVIALVVAAGWSLLRRRGQIARALGAILAGAIVLGLGGLTWQRAEALQSPASLWPDTLEKNPGSWMAKYNVANQFLAAGRELKADYEDMNRKANVLARQAEQFDARGRTAEAMRLREQARMLRQQAEPLQTEAIKALTRAEALYRGSMDIQPDYPRTYNNLGISLMAQGRTEEAIDLLRRGIEVDRRVATLHQGRTVRLQDNLGRALADTGRHDEAIDAWREALEFRPDMRMSYQNGLQLLVRLQRHRQLARWITGWIENHPDHAGAYQDRAVAHNRMGEYHRAVEDAGRALELNPAQAGAYVVRAQAYFHLREYNKAWQDLIRYRRMGNPVPPKLMESLRRASGGVPPDW